MTTVSNDGQVTVGTPVDVVLATAPGYLIAHSWVDQNMHLFWINGQHRATVKTGDTLIQNNPSPSFSQTHPLPHILEQPLFYTLEHAPSNTSEHTLIHILPLLSNTPSHNCHSPPPSHYSHPLHHSSLPCLSPFSHLCGGSRHQRTRKCAGLRTQRRTDIFTSW